MVQDLSRVKMRIQTLSMSFNHGPEVSMPSLANYLN